MKTLGGAASKSADSETAEAAPSGDNNGFFTANDKIDFSNVKVEPLFEEEVDFDTFSKSDSVSYTHLDVYKRQGVYSYLYELQISSLCIAGFRSFSLDTL